MKLPRCLNLLIIILLGYFLLQTGIVVLQLKNIYYVLGLNILFSGIVLALLYMSWKKVFAPLRELADKIDKMKDEQLYPVEENSDFSYEALSLIKAFNRLILTIKRYNEELKEKNHQMEKLNSEYAAQHQELEENLQELQTTKHNIEMFAELGMVMSGSRLELEEIAQNAIEFASFKLDFPLVAIYTQDKSGYYILLASRGIKGAVERFSAGESVMGAAVLDKKPIYVSRPEYGAARTETINGEEILPYQGYIPLIHREECQGLMVLASWKEIDGNLIEYMSRRIAVNLYNAYLHANLLHTYEQLHEEAALLEELSAQREEENEHARRDRNIAVALLESVEEALFFHLQDGRIYVHNQHFARMTGEKTPDNRWDSSLNVEDVMKTIIATMENPDKLSETMQQLKRDPDQTISLNIVQQEPSFASYEVFTAPVHDIVEGQDKILGRIWTFRDVSREYEINAMKNQFVSTVSHELRTPLSSIMGFTELMLSRELDSQKQKKYLETIEREARRLTDLINDFLDIQRMESGRVSYEISKFDLFEICEELAEVFQTKSDKHQILVRGIPPIMVKADLSKIEQVLNNLISNAVKYSPAGGQVEIELSLENEAVHMSIKDQGLGIPEESLPHIFERFYRVDNSDRRNIGGTGLGLAIVKELLDNMQGSVWAESKPGEGSIFHVCLPRAKDNEAMSKQQMDRIKEENKNE